MNSSFFVGAVVALIGSTGTILGVIISNRSAAARSYKEKIWDLRRLAYSLILSELGNIESICDNADEYIAEDSYRYFDAVEQKDNAKIAKHFEAINKRFAEDYLILSPEFRALYEEFRKARSADPYNSTPPEDHEVFVAAVRKYRPLLVKLADTEMTVRKKWWIF